MRDNGHYCFDFRCNFDNFELDTLRTFLMSNCKKFVFQHEKGEKTGYEHWGGRFSLYKKRRKMHMLKLPEWSKMNYLQPTLKDNTVGDKFYSYHTKEHTRVEGPFTDKDVPKYIPKQCKGEPKKWQQQVWSTADIFDDRTINCIVDAEGGKGKSWCVRAGRLRHGFVAVPVCANSKEIVGTVCDILAGKNCRNPKIIFVDIPRSIDNKRLNQLFSAIEIIKEGYVYDLRYKFKEWDFESPQIWCFTNNPLPDVYMSRDRWKYWEIVEDELVPMVPES